MTQEFFKTTLVSKFIKQLLAKSPVPIPHLIFDNDDMVKDCVYAYKDKILKCTHSGRFVGIRGTLGRNDYLYVQNPLRVNEGSMTVTRYDNIEERYKYEEIPFAVTDDVVSVNMYEPARFEILATLKPDTYQPGLTDIFISNTSYYDEQTHLRLGEYLRYLNNYYDLDLMPLYNCFNYNIPDNMTLTLSKDSKDVIKSTVIEQKSPKSKVYLVPIKFDRTYTIAIESAFPVLMKAVFYNDGILTDSTKQRQLSEYIDEPAIQYNSMQFRNPVTYTVSNKQVITDDSGKSYYSMLHNYERYLYLAIQVSVDNDSSVVVLEGDYSHLSKDSIADVMGVDKDVNTADAVSQMMTSRLSLLETNDGKHYPFSPKLIQYLLRNTIDTREYIDENVAGIEDAVDYNPIYKGLWDDELRYLLFTRYMKLEGIENMKHIDILGYVDSDIESAVRKGLLK